jgi:glycerophosphoryl diester phosphodiesterase
MSWNEWVQVGRPLVFAHRGGSRLAPENTTAAFDRAIAEGADGLELDIRLSRDGEAMVCHDARLDRTCDGHGAICDMTAVELSRIDAGFRFTPGDGTYPFRGCGVTVPTLRGVLARYPRKPLVVEIKDEHPAAGDAVVEAVREAGALDRVCFGSFHSTVLRRVRRLAPASTTSGSRRDVLLAVLCARLGFLPPRHAYRALQVPEARENTRVVTPRFVRAAHRAGVPVQVWIVDDADDIRRLLSWGVDGIITDRPDIAVRIVADASR